MERKLDEITERIVRLETAQHFRHQTLSQQMAQLLSRLEALQASLSSRTTGAWGGWLKVPLALLLPFLVFLVMLLVTGDLRAAMKAARLAG